MSYEHTSHATPGMLTLDLDAMGIPSPSHAEAPCSVNSKIEIAGMTLQVTGRGTTAGEMARNFRESVEALRAELAPQPPTVAEQVARIKSCWLEKAVVKGNLDCAQRIIKAAALVLKGAVQQSSDQSVWYVRSQSTENTYCVTLISRADESTGYACGCDDSQFRSPSGKSPCKHGLAVAMYNKLI